MHLPSARLLAQCPMYVSPAPPLTLDSFRDAGYVTLAQCKSKLKNPIPNLAHSVQTQLDSKLVAVLLPVCTTPGHLGRPTCQPLSPEPGIVPRHVAELKIDVLPAQCSIITHACSPPWPDCTPFLPTARNPPKRAVPHPHPCMHVDCCIPVTRGWACLRRELSRPHRDFSFILHR